MASSINNDVNIGGVQTITGRKVFNSNGFSKIILKSKDMDLNTTPTESINNQLWFADKNNVQYAVLQANKNNDGSVNFSMTMKAKSENNFSTLNIVQQADGTAFASAPTPPTSANNSYIATTAWASKRIPSIVGGAVNTKTLWTGNLDVGDISLSEPFTNFEQLLIDGSTDNNATAFRETISVFRLNENLSTGYSNVMLFNGFLYWEIKTYANGSTTTLFKQGPNNNCRIKGIYGLNRK